MNQPASALCRAHVGFLAATALLVLALAVRSAPAQTSVACVTEEGTCESTLQRGSAAHGRSAAAASLWLEDSGHIDEVPPSQLKHSGMATPTVLTSFRQVEKLVGDQL